MSKHAARTRAVLVSLTPIAYAEVCAEVPALRQETINFILTKTLEDNSDRLPRDCRLQRSLLLGVV